MFWCFKLGPFEVLSQMGNDNLSDWMTQQEHRNIPEHHTFKRINSFGFCLFSSMHINLRLSVSKNVQLSSIRPTQIRWVLSTISFCKANWSKSCTFGVANVKSRLNLWNFNLNLFGLVYENHESTHKILRVNYAFLRVYYGFVTGWILRVFFFTGKLRVFTGKVCFLPGNNPCLRVSYGRYGLSPYRCFLEPYKTI